MNISMCNDSASKYGSTYSTLLQEYIIYIPSERIGTYIEENHMDVPYSQLSRASFSRLLQLRKALKLPQCS